LPAARAGAAPGVRLRPRGTRRAGPRRAVGASHTDVRAPPRMADHAVTAPPDAAAQPFRYRLRVRYGECDVQKVVYNARYADYVDLAATEFLRAVWGDAIFSGGYDYQVVRLVLEWRTALRHDEIVQVTVSTSRIGTTSFVLAMDLRRLGA